MKLKSIVGLIVIMLLTFLFMLTGCKSSEIAELKNRVEKIERQLAQEESENTAIEAVEAAAEEFTEEEEPEEVIAEEAPEETEAIEEEVTEAESRDIESDKLEIQDGEFENLAEEIVNNGFNIKYIDYSLDKHPQNEYWNYVQIGIIDETIPVSGNWGGPEWNSVEKISQIIRKYYPDSEVWIICFINDINGHYAVSSYSIPELNIGGTSFGIGPRGWIYNGINPAWETDQ